MKKIFIISFFLIGILQVWSQNRLPITEISITGSDDVPEYYVRKLITFKEGDLHTKETLEKAIRKTEIIIQSDIYFYLAMIEYDVANGGITVNVTISRSFLRFIIRGFDSGALIGHDLYPQLDGNMYFHIGYGRQSTGLILKYIKGSRFGVDVNTGHLLVDKFDFDTIMSKVGGYVNPFISLNSSIDVGLKGQGYYYYDYNSKDTLYSIGTGAFLKANYKYLEDLYRVGFTFDFDYDYVLLGDDVGGNGFTGELSIYTSPFPTDRLEVNSVLYAGYLFDNTIEMLQNKISGNTIGRNEKGSFVWSAEVSTPVYIYDIEGPATFRLGIEPFFKIGDVRTAVELDTSDLEMVVGVGPALKVDFPVNVQIVPRIGYELSNGDLFFQVGFQYNQPYTRLLDSL